MFCINCGSKLDEDALFCTNCGKKVAEGVSKKEIKFCMNCGSKLDEDSSFCSNCGKKVEYNEPISTDTTTESSELETAKGISEVSTSVVENLSVVSAEKKSITVEETLDKNEQENSDIQDFIQESTKKEAETSKAVVERTQNENDKNHEMNENNVNLLSLKEYNCLSAEEKESYKSKLDSILEDEKTDADTKNTICKTLIQYGYIYYTHSKYLIKNKLNPTVDARNEIENFVSCLYCGEKISDSDEICPKCGREQSDYKELKIAGRKFLYIKDTAKVYCPRCYKRVDKNSTACFNCNANFMISSEDKNIERYILKTTQVSSENENKEKEKNDVFQKTSSDGKQGSFALTTILIIGFILSLALIILVNVNNNNVKNNSVTEHNTEFKVGDIIQENGIPIAVIFKEASGGQPALGVALKQGDSLQWASCHYDYEPGYSKTTVSQGYERNIQGLQNLTDGHDSYQILCLSVNDWQKKGNYPAFEFAENYSAGSFTDWYLPTANELYFLYINLEKVNQSLMQCGGKKIKIAPGEIFYWTCNQVNNTSWAAVCADFYYGIDSVRQNVGEGNQKGGGFKVLPICRVYIKEN